MKVFADGVLQLQAPQIEQGLIHKTEAALAIENVGEIGNRREGDIENARLAIEAETKIVRFPFGGFAVGDVDDHAGEKSRLTLAVALNFAASLDPGEGPVAADDPVAFLEAIVRAFEGFGDRGGKRGAIIGMNGVDVFLDGPAGGIFGAYAEERGEIAIGDDAIVDDVPGPGGDFVGEQDGLQALVGVEQIFLGAGARSSGGARRFANFLAT